MTPIIEFLGVSKRFAGRVAVEPLNLSVERGSIYGLLGHNGAGKSTSLGMLLGQVFPDAGSVRIGGTDVFENRHKAMIKVGAIFESYNFYDYLSGMSNLRIFCEYSAPVPKERLTQVIKLVGLEGRINDRVSAYSHGMKQRLALAQALLPNPEVLVLDEPTDGLDPQGIVEMRQLVRKLNREMGMTVLLSSHLLHEVEELCTHVAVMHRGKLLFAGVWDKRDQGRWLRVGTDRNDVALPALLSAGLAERVEPDGRVRLIEGRTAAMVARWLLTQGFEISEISPHRPSLEEFYLELVGPTGRENDGSQSNAPVQPQPQSVTTSH